MTVETSLSIGALLGAAAGRRTAGGTTPACVRDIAGCGWNEAGPGIGGGPPKPPGAAAWLGGGAPPNIGGGGAAPCRPALFSCSSVAPSSAPMSVGAEAAPPESARSCPSNIASSPAGGGR